MIRGLSHRRRYWGLADVPAAQGPRRHRRGAQGQLTVRADSECYARVIVAVCPGMDVRLSITPASTKACAISSRRSQRGSVASSPAGWTAPPMWPRPPALPLRASPTPGSQLAVSASCSYHGIITERDGEMIELEDGHRCHAEVENAILGLR